jgi:hypothetical protein
MVLAVVYRDLSVNDLKQVSVHNDGSAFINPNAKKPGMRLGRLRNISPVLCDPPTANCE